MESGSRSKKPLLWIGVAVAALALIATSLADTDDLSEKRYSSAAADLGETPTELAMVEGAPIPVSYLCGDGGKAIVRLYVAYFDRGPDAPGLRYWSEVYQDSDLPTVAYWMSQSPEFQQRWTGVNDRDYVTGALYRNLLDRRPDKDGLDYWVQDTKKVNRDELALYWVQTPELVRKIPVNVPARCPGASDNIVTQPPVTGQPAATVRKPATTQRPATTRTPATTRRPATTRTPVTTRRPATTRTPVTTRRPATTRKPVTTRTPATTTKPVTTTKPIAVGSGCVGNRVWKDTNRDGIHQSNEPGFNGLVVRLVNTSNKTVDQTTTKNGGYYLVCGAPGSNQIKVQIPGNYTVSPSNKGTSDWKDSDANSNGVIAVTVAKDQNVKKYDIGLITDTRRPFNQGNVSWKLIQSDDFNGTKLDDKMWEYGWFSASNGSKYDRPVAGGETACYHTDQVTLSGGELSLTMRPTTAAEDASGVCRKRDGSKAKFVSGYATTRNRYQVQPGTYIETRMYMPGQGDVVYNWPAFWTTDVDKAFGSKWPHHGEFDILEVMKGKPCSNFHYATSADGAHKQTGKRCSSIKPNRWVVIGMKWNYDGTVEYYHDGKRIQDTNGRGDWTIDPPSLAGPFAKNWSHNILLQNAMHSADRTGYKEPTANNPLTVKFDYVDVYKL